MIFRKILEQKEKIIAHHTNLMTGSLKMLVFRLGLEQDVVEPGKYEIVHDDVSYTFLGYKSYSKEPMSDINLEVAKKHFLDIQFTRNIDTDLLSTEIANIFLSNGKKVKNAYDGFHRFILEVREIMKNIERYSITPIVHINRIKIGPYELKWFPHENDWELSVGFGKVICESADIYEIIKVVKEDLKQRAQVTETEVVYNPNAKKLMKPALEYFSKMVDSDIVAPPTKFRKTYNGIIATPEEYVVYEDIIVGYYDEDTSRIISIRAMAEKTDHPIKFGRYKNVGFDHNDRTLSVPKLANIMKKTALSLKKENEDFIRIMEEMKQDFDFDPRGFGLEIRKPGRSSLVGKIYTSETYGKYIMTFTKQDTELDLTCDGIIDLLQMHAQYEEY